MPVLILVVTVGIKALQPDPAANERMACAAINEIWDALAAFERDHGQAALEAWNGEVAGLRDFIPPGASRPLELLRPEIAAADPRRPNARPFAGNWFVLLEADVETDEGPAPPRWRSRTTVCAYPAEYRRTGTSTIMRSRAWGWLQSDTKGVPPSRTPSKFDVGQSWSKRG